MMIFPFKFGSKSTKATKHKGKRRSKRIIALQVLLVGIVLIAAGLFYYYILKDLPSPTALSAATNSQSTKIYDRNWNLLFTIYANKNQTFVPLKRIPVHLQHATIAIEDKDFYRHGAVDFRGMTRALFAIVVHNRLEGGSTITQQLVKNGLLTQDRTITRKIKEVILSFATEALYSKDQILEMYLNQTPYGGTSWGAEAAAQTYFGKDVWELDLAQSALLAGLPESPTSLSPFGTHPERAKARQEQILRKMHEQGYITKAQRDQAIAEPLHYQKISNKIYAPHFVLYVKDLLVQKYGQHMVEQGGLKVRTSLDLSIQDMVQASVSGEVEKLANYNVRNGAAMVTNPGTGEILAMVGSRDYFDTTNDGNVNVTLSYRQPGSSIKPINYAVGLLKGYTAATPFVDQATCFPGRPSYCPVNYDGKFNGVTQMRQSLGSSLNIPAVKMLKLNGVDAMIATASAMGITTFVDSPDRYGLSLTLGGGEVTMLQMATAFGVFANQGYRVDLRPILAVEDAKGNMLESYTPLASPIFGKKVLPSGVTYIISHMLLDNNARLLAFGSNSELRIGNEPIPVKTGTTNDYRDNWTIGYTQAHVVVTWVGNNDNRPMTGLVSGITGAAPIWHDIMVQLVQKQKPQWPPKPDSVIGKTICSTSGLIPPPDGTPDRCPTRFEYFIKGTEPRIVDPGRQKVWIDKGTNDLAKAGQTDNVEERSEVVVTDPTGDRYCLTCPHPSPTPKP